MLAVTSRRWPRPNAKARSNKYGGISSPTHGDKRSQASGCIVDEKGIAKCRDIFARIKLETGLATALM